MPRWGAPSLTLTLTPAPQRGRIAGNLGELDRTSCLQVQYNGTAGGEALAEKLSKVKAYYSMLEEKWVAKYYTQSKTRSCQYSSHAHSALSTMGHSLSYGLGNADLNVFNPNGNVYANFPSLAILLPCLNLIGKVTVHYICQRKRCLFNLPFLAD